MMFWSVYCQKAAATKALQLSALSVAVAHQKPIMMKMEPSFTMVVPGTEGSNRSLIWARIPTLCTHPHTPNYASTKERSSCTGRTHAALLARAGAL